METETEASIVVLRLKRPLPTADAVITLATVDVLRRNLRPIKADSDKETLEIAELLKRLRPTPEVVALNVNTELLRRVRLPEDVSKAEVKAVAVALARRNPEEEIVSEKAELEFLRKRTLPVDPVVTTAVGEASLRSNLRPIDSIKLLNAIRIGEPRICPKLVASMTTSNVSSAFLLNSRRTSPVTETVLETLAERLILRITVAKNCPLKPKAAVKLTILEGSGVTRRTSVLLVSIRADDSVMTNRAVVSCEDNLVILADRLTDVESY